MKIGIITHHYVKNFGAFLQTYALQEYLKSNFEGAEVYIINYVVPIHQIINIGGCYRFFIHHETIKSYLQKIKLPKTFKESEKKYLNLTKKVRNASDINKLGFDYIIIGSDEVWHYQSKAASPIKFGKGLTCKNIISYAPSTGGVSLAEGIPDYVIEGLRNLKGISVRDEVGEQLVEKCTGKKAPRVLDPTLIYDFKEYRDAFCDGLKKEKYILMYHCTDLPKAQQEQIREYADKNGYKIRGAGEYAKYYDDITVNLTPFQWVEMFRNAAYVFTGTFHGAVFALMTHRNFSAYLTDSNKSRKQKVFDLLSLFSLTNRIVDNGDVLRNVDEAVDYNYVESVKEAVREQSVTFLKDYIKK